MKGILIGCVIGAIMWAVIIMCATSLQPATIALPYRQEWPRKLMSVDSLGISYWQARPLGLIMMIEKGCPR